MYNIGVTMKYQYQCIITIMKKVILLKTTHWVPEIYVNLFEATLIAH